MVRDRSARATECCRFAGLNSPVLAAVAIGSNLGDRRGHIAWAIEQLGSVLHNLRASHVIETDPVGVPGVQPPYLNAVVVGEAQWQPRELLHYLLDLESQRGRRRVTPLAPRTLDLDLVLYGDVVLDEAALVVPHPRFRERRFVLEPLAEISPDLRDPVTGKTVLELLQAL